VAAMSAEPVITLRPASFVRVETRESAMLMDHPASVPTMVVMVVPRMMRMRV